ncbi:MAG: M50 family metallopeptidase [Mariprofundaceae bacterium]|nr:M50 family metallopeptidase [Mariprofundaceae bacterium]
MTRPLSSNIEFLVLVMAALFLSWVPFLSIPFTWFMTFFHEISHGLMALFTGGSIASIVLHWDGSGLCYTRGGSRFLVLQAGYIGAVVWGVLLYHTAHKVSERYIVAVVAVLGMVIAGAALLYARDVVTWLILAFLFALSVSIGKLQHLRGVNIALKFVAVYVMLDAVRAPLYLIDGKHYGDAASLSDLTGLPEMIWIILWLAVGLAGVFHVWRSNA